MVSVLEVHLWIDCTFMMRILQWEVANGTFIVLRCSVSLVSHHRFVISLNTRRPYCVFWAEAFAYMFRLWTMRRTGCCSFWNFGRFRPQKSTSAFQSSFKLFLIDMVPLNMTFKASTISICQIILQNLWIRFKRQKIILHCSNSLLCQ